MTGWPGRRQRAPLPGSWSQELEDGFAEGQLATRDAQHRATPERVATARALFTEAKISDFSPLGSRGKLRHKESGVEYVVEQGQVLEALAPHKSGVEFFLLHGGRLLLLRPRGFDASERSVPGEVLSGELQPAPGGGARLVDARTGSLIREKMRI